MEHMWLEMKFRAKKSVPCFKVYDPLALNEQSSLRHQIREIPDFFLDFFGYGHSDIPIGSMGRLHICLHERLIFMINLGKYMGLMDPMG